MEIPGFTRKSRKRTRSRIPTSSSPATCSGSRPVRILIIASLAVAALLAAPAPGEAGKRASISSLGKEGLQDALRSGELSFLRDIDPTKLKEAARLGPGAAYCLSLHYERLGMADRAAALCAIEWDEGPSSRADIARIEAGRALMAYARAAGDWKEALSRSDKFLRILPRDLEALYSRLESLSRLGEWKKALGANGALLPADYGAKRSSLARACLAAASLRAGAPGGREAVDAMLRDERDPQAVLLLSELLDAEGAGASPLRARRYVAQREYGPACLDFAAFPSLVLDPGGKALVSDMGRAWLSGGEAAQGAQRLAELDGRLGKERTGEKAMARLWGGRCLLALGKADEARERLRACVEIAAPGEEADAAAWFLIDSFGDRKRKIDAVASTAPSWSAPGYFDDELDGLVRDCIVSGSYRELERLAGALNDRAGASIRRRCSYVLDRARALGLLGGKRREGGARAASGGAEDLSYFAIMEAAFLSGPEPSIAGIESSPNAEGDEECVDAFLQAGSPPPAMGGSARPSAAKPAPSAKPSAEEAFILGLIDYGLPEDAAEAASAYSPLLRPDFLRDCAKRLFASGHPLPCARFMAALAAKHGYVRERDDLLIVYPRPWREAFRAASAESGLPESLLYALARTESSFDPLARSRAGAFGLAQLMPDTARDAAAKLGMRDPDLGDPATSIRIGAAYLAGLLRYFAGDLSKALMSYNGGMGRVRSWARENPSLPSDLLLEAAPLAETREYLRKVLAAQAVYGYLYDNRPMSGAAIDAFRARSAP